MQDNSSWSPYTHLGQDPLMNKWWKYGLSTSELQVAYDRFSLRLVGHEGQWKAAHCMLKQ